MSFLSNALNYVGLGGNEKAPSRPAGPVGGAVKSITSIRSRRYDSGQIVTVNLSSYSQARTVSDAFREGNSVIVEMSNASHSDQQKMVNYMCGLKEGLEGTLERVTETVFLLAHYGVTEGQDFDDSAAGHDDLGLGIRPVF